MRRLVSTPSAPGAQAVFADRGQRQPERRVRKPARDRKQNEEDGETVERRVALPGEADREQSEHGRHREVETVRAAGDPAVAVGQFSQHQRNAQRHHQSRQVGAAKQERRADETDEGGDRGANGEPKRGLGEPLARENGRGVSAETKERRVAERDDSGQPENEIERQSEQAGDERFVDDRRARRQSEDQGQNREPEHDFRPPPARAPLQMRGEAGFVAAASGALIARLRAQTILAGAR